MKLEIRNGRVIDPASGFDGAASVCVESGRIVAVGAPPAGFVAERVVDATGCIVCPGLVDVAVRLREPGLEFKATLESDPRLTLEAKRETQFYAEQSEALAKRADDPVARERLATVLYTTCEALRAVAVLHNSVMPRAMGTLWASIGAAEGLGAIGDQRIEDVSRWGQLPAGVRVTKGAALFPRLQSRCNGAESGAMPGFDNENSRGAAAHRRTQEHRIRPRRNRCRSSRRGADSPPSGSHSRSPGAA